MDNLEQLMKWLYQTKPLYTDTPDTVGFSTDLERKNYLSQFEGNPLWEGLNHLYDQDPTLHQTMLKRLLDRGLNQDLNNLNKRGAFTDTPPKDSNKWLRF